MTDIIIQKQDQVLRISIDRPARKNALTQPMYETMTKALLDARTDKTVRVVVISGTDGSFCSGNDLSAFPKKTKVDGSTFVWDFLEALVRAPYPVLAAVDGVAAGIGATMLLHMDGVIASPESRIFYSFINMALVPEAGSSLLMPQLMGYTKAADLLMCGNPITGQQAFNLGIVSTLSNGAQVEAKAISKARELAKKPPNALRRTKALLKGDIEALLQRVRQEEKELFAQLGSEEFSTSLKAFQDKSRGRRQTVLRRGLV